MSLLGFISMPRFLGAFQKYPQLAVLADIVVGTSHGGSNGFALVIVQIIRAQLIKDVQSFQDAQGRCVGRRNMKIRSGLSRAPNFFQQKTCARHVDLPKPFQAHQLGLGDRVGSLRLAELLFNILVALPLNRFCLNLCGATILSLEHSGGIVVISKKHWSPGSDVSVQGVKRRDSGGWL
ncbi:hypothetical protein, partial [Flavimaricola marinus]|uniref:hypothetical protein n=1 Tax=Flavimaricola marinus TaxID=1819565 RepID=UPI003F99EA4D